MRTLMLAMAAFAPVLWAKASWYWPFEGDEADEPPRLAEILEPASTNIDAAADFMADGKTVEALASYRRALSELDRIEREHADRADLPEFASVRTKRAYVSAAIDAIETVRARSNARAVVTTDTAELELALKSEKMFESDLRKAADLVAQAHVLQTAVVTNWVDDTDGAGDEAKRPVVTNRTEIVTNLVACAHARQLLDMLGTELDKLTEGHEARDAQPYFAYLAGSRAEVEKLKKVLGSAEAIAKKSEDEPERRPRDARPKMTDQFDEARTNIKERVALLRKRGDSARTAKESAERIRREIEENPDGRRARLLRCGRSLRAGKYDEAEREIDALLKADRRDAAALNLYAAVAAARKDYREAERRYKDAIDLVPENHYAYYNLARLRLRHLKDRKGAAEAYVDGRHVGGPKDAKLEELVK